MVNLTQERFEKLLNSTSGVENYKSTFVYKGKTYKKSEFEIKTRHCSFWHYFSWFFSKIKIEARPEAILYDRPKVEKVLSLR